MSPKTIRAACLHRVGEPMAVERIPVPEVRATDVRK
jgi:hypothetical protein